MASILYKETSLCAFIQSIFETVRHPLLVIDGQMQIRKANVPFYRTFAVTELETEGHLLYQVAGLGDIPGLRLLLEAVIPADAAFEDFEVEYSFPHLGDRHLLLNARRLSHETDEAPMLVLAIEDVTIARQTQRELRRLNAELERRVGNRTSELEAANRELEAFSYSVSHDLRTPLRAIDGFSNELLRNYDGQLDDRGQHYLHRIRSGTQRMGQLIDEMLRLSLLNRGEMRRGRVDLSALAETIVAELRQREPSRQATFVIEPSLIARGDGAMLRIVLENLLGNAWKFTAKRPAASIHFGRTEHDGRAAFFVRDDGTGFDMAHASKLFGAFQRLHAEREFPGTGIGLATVQRVIRRHSGQVWAESKPDQGATFYFTLPEENSP